MKSSSTHAFTSPLIDRNLPLRTAAIAMKLSSGLPGQTFALLRMEMRLCKDTTSIGKEVMKEETLLYYTTFDRE